MENKTRNVFEVRQKMSSKDNFFLNRENLMDFPNQHFYIGG